MEESGHEADGIEKSSVLSGEISEEETLQLVVGSDSNQAEYALVHAESVERN